MSKKIVSLFLALLMAVSMTTAMAESITVTDMFDREVTLTGPITRIVALEPSDCEILCALGCEEALVGRGKYCDYPASVLELPAVASGANTNLEEILALKPQVVVMSDMAHTEEQVNLLVENLVNVARKRESEKTTVSLSALSAEMGLLYSKVAENKGVSLEIVMERGLWVLADEQELRQILINLINNSIKALSAGGRVTLTGSAGAEGIGITVADNGPGMDDAQLSRALEGGGGGQGLPIVRRLVEENGGRLAFDTQPGQGTRAILTFHGGTDHEV